MKALTFKRYGKSPDIGFADVPRPTLKADEMLVQVHAASVNPVDNMIMTGVFKPVLHFQLPATLGSDLAGVVIEVGRSLPNVAGSWKCRTGLNTPVMIMLSTGLTLAAWTCTSISLAFTAGRGMLSNPMSDDLP